MNTIRDECFSVVAVTLALLWEFEAHIPLATGNVRGRTPRSVCVGYGAVAWMTAILLASLSQGKSRTPRWHITYDEVRIVAGPRGQGRQDELTRHRGCRQDTGHTLWDMCLYINRTVVILTTLSSLPLPDLKMFLVVFEFFRMDMQLLRQSFRYKPLTDTHFTKALWAHNWSLVKGLLCFDFDYGPNDQTMALCCT